MFTNTKINAVYAATDTEPTVEIVHGSPKYCYTGGGSGTKYGNTSCAVSSMAYSSFTYSGSVASTSPTTTGASYTVGSSSKDYCYKGVYESFTLKVTMPAGKKYALKFNFSMYSSKNSTNASSSARARAEVFYFGENDCSSSLNFALAHSGGTTPGSSSWYTLNYCQTSSNSTSSTSGSATTYVTYDNSDSSSSKEFTSYFGFYAYAGGAANIHTQLSANWSYSYEVLHNPVQVPTIDAELEKIDGAAHYYIAEYNGEEQIFPFTMDETYITVDRKQLSSTYAYSGDGISFYLKDDAFWDDERGGVGWRDLYISIIPGTPNVVVNKITSCSKLPDKVPIDTAKSTKGTISWTEDATLENPTWKFVATDNNYDSTPVYGTAEVDLKHVFDDEHHVEGVDATCTEDGYTEYWQCTVCEKYFADEDGNDELTSDQFTIEALGHDMTEVPAVAATCNDNGNYKYYSCSRCDGLFWDSAGNSACTAEKVVETKLGHSLTDTVVDPTCTSRGYTTHTCTRDGCGYTYDDTYTDMSPHSWDEGEITKEATCTATGVKTYTCSECGNTQTEQIAKAAHTPESIDAVDATCTEKGKTEGSKCSVCNEILTAQQDTNALGHAAGEWIEDDEPTCTETGAKHKECTVCGETVETGTIPAKGHDYQAVEGGVAPTCTEPGSGKVKCTRCDDEQVGASIPALGHAEVTDEAVEATCLETGLTAGVHCSRCEEVLTAQEEVPALGHDFGEWVVTTEATFTEDGLQRRGCSRCDEFEEEVIPAKGVEENEITIVLGAEFEFGDEIAPVISSKYGEYTIVWYDTETGDELAEKPTTPGSYKLVVSVEENLEEGYTGAEKEVEFTIKKRAITVTINPASSVAGDELEALTATVTSGSIVNGDEPYTLSTNAIAETMGEYEITGECTDDNYEITFENAVYIVSKKVEDEGGNEIDMPTDIDVEFKVTQRQTGNAYAELAGMKRGYWAQLWYRNGDGTLGEEYTDVMNCILTLRIPDEIIEAIRGDEPIDREKIAEGLRVYYVDEDGDLKKVKPFTITQKEDESWIVKFNYNQKFRAEVVFHALGIEEAGAPVPTAGIPWWVWLIVGLAGAAFVGVVIVIIVVIKKKNGVGTTVIEGAQYDDAELKAKLSAQDRKLDEIKEIVDGGFNDTID